MILDIRINLHSTWIVPGGCWGRFELTIVRIYTYILGIPTVYLGSRRVVYWRRFQKEILFLPAGRWGMKDVCVLPTVWRRHVISSQQKCVPNHPKKWIFFQKYVPIWCSKLTNLVSFSGQFINFLCTVFRGFFSIFSRNLTAIRCVHVSPTKGGKVSMKNNIKKKYSFIQVPNAK